jgi:citrate lyase subunit beta/citryl-CoA lyase
MTDTSTQVPTLAERRSAREEVRVRSEDARSWLLLSALHPERFDSAQLSRADQVILDMEDAVDQSRKQEARDNVIGWLTGGGSAWVRINDWSNDAWEQDIAQLTGLPGLAGVMLAKVESAEQVTDTFQRLGGHTDVMPLIESAVGIEDAGSIARARGATRLAFGSGDYRRDTGAGNDNLAMAYPRTRLVLASRLGNLPGPVDGPTVASTHPVLREQAGVAVSMGMTGKLCLDFEQPDVINECMSPSSADVRWAFDFLAEFEANGRVIRDGSDKPRLARAEIIRTRAERFRITPS